MNRIGFDNKQYLFMQSEKIQERIDAFGDKLYLEFGGKLFDDYHASRVLPGFEPDSKIKMLLKLRCSIVSNRLKQKYSKTNFEIKNGKIENSSVYYFNKKESIK